MRFDNEWFKSERARLLGDSRVFQGKEASHAIAALVRGARTSGQPAKYTNAVLARVAPIHALAIRAHLQFYRAALVSVGVVASDRLVNAIAQVEWLWYTTPFKPFYRDHLAHVLKVSLTAITLLEQMSAGGKVWLDRFAEELATRKVGMPALRAVARRCGLTELELEKPETWRLALLETVRLAGLLHDLAYPDVMADKVDAVAHPTALDGLAGDPTSNQALPRRVTSGRLLTAPFTGCAVSNDGLLNADHDAFLAAYELSHAPRAGCVILSLADERDRTWRLTPIEKFVFEWAALATTMHDLDKVHELAGKSSGESRNEKTLVRWLSSPPDSMLAKDRTPNKESVRPSYRRDPASFVLALADQIQEFGRMHYVVDDSRSMIGAHETRTFCRYPVAAVTFEAQNNVAVIRTELAPHAATYEDGAHRCTAKEEGLIRAHKSKDERRLFERDGWFDYTGLFDQMRWEVAPR